MTNINLLPWREQQREQDKKLFMALMLISLVASMLIVALLYFYASHLKSNQTKRNARLQEEITFLDKQIELIKNLRTQRDQLVSRMMIAMNLQATRALTVHLFDELIKIMPEGVYLTELVQEGNTVTVSGYAESNTLISDLMRNIENDLWIHQPLLTEIKSVDILQGKKATPDKNNLFTLRFTLESKEAEAEQKMINDMHTQNPKK